jgi:membrane protein required for colicin V production
MITWLDGLLIAVMLISGLLAMVRGFMREVLSIAAWLAAAIMTLYLDAKLLPTAEGYFNNKIIANVVVIAGVFLATLLIVSAITIKISDMILDSRIGALDRTLGFLFGLGRGLLIVVVAFLFVEWLVPPKAQPSGVRDAKSQVVLKETGKWLTSLLPEELDTLLARVFKKRPKTDEEAEPPPGQRSDRFEPETSA